MKNKVLSLLTVMSLLSLVSCTISATDTMDKKSKKTKQTTKNAQASKPVKKSQKNHKSNLHHHEKTGKGHMHEIERELDQIYADFEKNGDKQAAKDKLAMIPDKITAAVEQMKKSEMHGSMWKRHEHKLREKLKEITKKIK